MSTGSSAKFILVEKNKGAEIIKTVKLFFGIKVRTTYNRSRIVRRPARAYEEFIFRGFDKQKPDLYKPAAFKRIRFIGKN